MVSDEKRELIQALLCLRRPVPEISERCEVSIRTVYRIKAEIADVLAQIDSDSSHEIVTVIENCLTTIVTNNQEFLEQVKKDWLEIAKKGKPSDVAAIYNAIFRDTVQILQNFNLGGKSPKPEDEIPEAE